MWRGGVGAAERARPSLCARPRRACAVVSMRRRCRRMSSTRTPRPCTSRGAGTRTADLRSSSANERAEGVVSGPESGEGALSRTRSASPIARASSDEHGACSARPAPARAGRRPSRGGPTSARPVAAAGGGRPRGRTWRVGAGKGAAVGDGTGTGKKKGKRGKGARKACRGGEGQRGKGCGAKGRGGGVAGEVKQDMLKFWAN